MAAVLFDLEHKASDEKQAMLSITEQEQGSDQTYYARLLAHNSPVEEQTSQRQSLKNLLFGDSLDSYKGEVPECAEYDEDEVLVEEIKNECLRRTW